MSHVNLSKFNEMSYLIVFLCISHGLKLDCPILLDTTGVCMDHLATAGHGYARPPRAAT